MRGTHIWNCCGSIRADDNAGLRYLYPKANSAIPTNGTVTVEWNVPASESYKVYWGTTNNFTYSDSTSVINCSPSVATAVLSSLTNGTQYYIAVARVGSIRKGSYSNQLSSIPSSCRSNFDSTTPGSTNDIDFDDFFLFADHYGEPYTDGSYQQKFDLNGNRIVDTPDSTIFLGDYGHNCAYPKLLVMSEDTPVPNDGRNKAALVNIESENEDSNNILDVKVGLSNIVNLKGYGVRLSYDSESFEIVSLDHETTAEANLLSGQGNTPLYLERSDGGVRGVIEVAGALPRSGAPISGDGVVVGMKFKKISQKADINDITVDRVVLLDGSFQKNPATAIRKGPLVVAGKGHGGNNLLPNMPNPFNPETTISFYVAEESQSPVSLTIYNVNGQAVRHLISNMSLESGQHAVVWDTKDDNGENMAAGVYLYQLEVGTSSYARKLTLLR